MRVLALDLGDKRIGVALSDPTGTLASPHATLTSSTQASDVEAVLRLVSEHEVELVVVGLPLSLSGNMGPQGRRASGFARALSDRAVVPVQLLDERFSTVQAQRLLRETGVQPSRQKARVDAAAAAVVLQAFLDSGGARRPD